MTADADRSDFAARFARMLEAFPVSAAPFVVTLYGDVVAPRGGELWTGNIVETLATVGIGELARADGAEPAGRRREAGR